jgi:hypothetical protein
MQKERRFHPRIRMETPCWLGASSKSTLLECQLEDLSDFGAKIMLPYPATLPLRVQLYFTKDRTVVRESDVVWRSGVLVGLSFRERFIAARR